MHLRLSRTRAFVRVASVLGAVGLSLVFLSAASAQVTAPPTTVNIAAGATITDVTLNGAVPAANVAVVLPGSSNTITATVTIPWNDSGYWYSVPIGFEGSATPFDVYNCIWGYPGGVSTGTDTFTAPNTAGVYNIGVDIGPNYCDVAWHPAGQGTIAKIVVTSYSSVCSLAESYSTDPAVAAGLCDKLRAAQDAATRGNTKAEANIMSAFGNLVAAQTGKALTADQADMLMTLVFYL